MISEPEKRISERALKVWRIFGAIQSVFMWMIAVGVTILTIIFHWPIWIPAGLIIIAIISSYFFIILLPVLRWKRWRYEVRDQEIELQHGVFIIKRTLVPMIRVQHVDTQQGPLLRKYHLATVTVSTAATVHEIPALDMEEAEELRSSISRLARVADEDV
ncbi:PH domain-containing protein [Bacillus methanolicus]|uniref:Membrane-flanked domain protein n=1 Tax=Bacillus methanolicus (strain MGA3 / ATCC 53907) TaxID=796606 RepID=I3E3S9_BACMM|nr:PH domain-containing protein [Bacillus methanolicus]AIE58743.1 membrane-flanked domain protein [Bacillus methanolicus MGA3]EIJ81150.1 membrane-flanked domain protein [Bacillus methanolicus MGA3]